MKAPFSQAGNHGQPVNPSDQARRRQLDAGQASQQQAENEIGAQNKDQRPPSPTADPVAALGLHRQGLEGDHDTQDGHQTSQDQGKIAGPHAAGHAQLVSKGAPPEGDTQSHKQQA
jgi:hypothetical protein